LQQHFEYKEAKRPILQFPLACLLHMVFTDSDWQ